VQGADAADRVDHDSLWHDHQARALCEGQGIIMLGAEAVETIRLQLYGQNAAFPVRV